MAQSLKLNVGVRWLETAGPKPKQSRFEHVGNWERLSWAEMSPDQLGNIRRSAYAITRPRRVRVALLKHSLIIIHHLILPTLHSYALTNFTTATHLHFP